MTGLLELGRDARISEKERSMVVEGLRILDEEFDIEKEGRQPRISDLVALVRSRHRASPRSRRTVAMKNGMRSARSCCWTV